MDVVPGPHRHQHRRRYRVHELHDNHDAGRAVSPGEGLCIWMHKRHPLGALLLVAKSAAELLVRTIADGDNQFVHWQSWMLVIGLVVLALSQLYYLHRGLKPVSTSVLYPLIFCIYNIIAILDGADLTSTRPT